MENDLGGFLPDSSVNAASLGQWQGPRGRLGAGHDRHSTTVMQVMAGCPEGPSLSGRRREKEGSLPLRGGHRWHHCGTFRPESEGEGGGRLVKVQECLDPVGRWQKCKGGLGDRKFGHLFVNDMAANSDSAITPHYPPEIALPTSFPGVLVA